MSQFSSTKIKINENEHLATLLAEYGGDFEIKVWILDKDDAWTGELSSEEAEEFISRFDLTKEVFLEELQRALTTSDPIVSYSISKIDNRGYVLSWKKCLDSGITMKNGEITIEKVSREDIYEEVIERSMEHNSLLQAQVKSMQKEKLELSEEKNMLLTRMDDIVNEKVNFEKNIYSQFLSVLNAKKRRISELQEYVDQIASSSSKGTLSEDFTQRAVKKEPEAEEAPKRKLRKTQEKKIEIKKEEVDPFEVDTDEEEEEMEDVITPRPNKRHSTEVRSQSFSQDSFDEISSPVAVLPKRSKLKPKEEVKTSFRASPEKPRQKVETEEDLLDQL